MVQNGLLLSLSLQYQINNFISHATTDNLDLLEKKKRLEIIDHF